MPLHNRLRICNEYIVYFLFGPMFNDLLTNISHFFFCSRNSVENLDKLATKKYTKQFSCDQSPSTSVIAPFSAKRIPMHELPEERIQDDVRFQPILEKPVKPPTQGATCVPGNKHSFLKDYSISRIAKIGVEKIKEECQRQWSSLEISGRESYRMGDMSKRRVKSYEEQHKLNMDPLRITEFLNGPFNDEEVRDANGQLAESLPAKHKLIQVGKSFDTPSQKDENSPEIYQDEIQNRVSKKTCKSIVEQGSFEGVVAVSTTEAPHKRVVEDQKVRDWRQNSHSRRQSFGNACSIRRGQRPTLAGNSFDSVATDYDASESSHCEVTTTSMESTTTTASTDSTGDSKSHKLHQMRDDSGYKSLETQQSVKRSGLQSTSPGVCPVESRLSTASCGGLTPVQLQRSFDSPGVHHHEEASRAAADKTGALLGSGSHLSAAEICSMNKQHSLDISRVAGTSKVLPTVGSLKNLGPRPIERRLASVKPFLAISTSQPSVQKEEFSKPVLDQQSTKKCSSLMETGNYLGKCDQAINLEQSNVCHVGSQEIFKSLESDNSKNTTPTSSVANALASKFGRMWLQAEQYISSAKSQAETLLGKVREAETRPQEEIESERVEMKSREVSPGPQKDIHYGGKWKAAARMVGDSLNKANSFPETVQKKQLMECRSNSDSIENASIYLGNRRSPIKLNTSVCEKLLVDKEVHERNSRKNSMSQSSAAKLNRAETIPNQFELCTGNRFVVEPPASYQTPYQVQANLGQVEKPNQVEKLGQTEKLGQLNISSKFCQGEVLPKRGPLDLLRRGELKTASKKRRAYRSCKQKEEILDVDTSLEKGQTPQTMESKTFSIGGSFGSSQDFSGEDGGSSANDDVTFFQHPSGGFIYRDYSVDAKTEAIFNEFLQFDPELEAKSSRPSARKQSSAFLDAKVPAALGHRSASVDPTNCPGARFSRRDFHRDSLNNDRMTFESDRTS